MSSAHQKAAATRAANAAAAAAGRDLRLEAIRADHIVGRGSCSVIDECYTDAELAEWLTAQAIRSPRQALAAARWQHRLWADRMKEMEAL